MPGIMLLAMDTFRTPLIALMPDITPSPLRSKANGVINLMGGIGALLATFGGAALYSLVPWVLEMAPRKRLWCMNFLQMKLET